MADPTDSGIYEIVNLVNGKRYIGSAVNFRNRWAEHRRGLRRGTHHSRALQRAWAKYGEAAFSFRIIEACERGQLISFEQTAIDRHRPEYNICKTAGSTLGTKHSVETRAKMSAVRTGKVGNRGYKHTDEARARMGAGKIGLKYPPRSEEHCRKISEAKKGISRNFGRAVSEETREKIRAANIGKRHSLETRRKRSSLTDDTVRQLRALRHSGLTYGKIAAALSLKASLVKRVCLRERYDWVDPDEPALTATVIGRGGWKHSEASRVRRSLANKARWEVRRQAGLPNAKHKTPRTAEQRERIAAAAKAAWDRRRAAGNTSRPSPTPEQRANYSAAAKQAWERRKATAP